MINQLHISTVNHDWSGTKLVALTQNNIDNIIKEKNLINCCTSPEDLSFENIHRVIDSALEIHLLDIDFYKTNLKNFDIYGRLLNELIRQKDKIVGTFNFRHHWLPTVSRPKESVLWSAGCSITYGTAVAIDQRYSSLVAKSLGKKEICLARGGSSIFWSADSILRADLEPGDMVLWGLTNVPRVEIAKLWHLQGITVDGYINLKQMEKYWTPDWFNSPTQTLMSLHYIDQVQNFCKKLKVELYIVNVLDIAWISVMLTKYPNYIDLLQNLELNENIVQYIDYGFDHQHPGPLQHQKWADQLLEFINTFKNH